MLEDRDFLKWLYHTKDIGGCHHANGTTIEYEGLCIAKSFTKDQLQQEYRYYKIKMKLK